RDDLELAYVERYRELTEANRRLRELARFKDELIAIISHDLRAPLQVTLGHGRMLEDANLPGTSGPPPRPSSGSRGRSSRWSSPSSTAARASRPASPSTCSCSTSAAWRATVPSSWRSSPPSAG